MRLAGACMNRRPLAGDALGGPSRQRPGEVEAFLRHRRPPGSRTFGQKAGVVNSFHKPWVMDDMAQIHSVVELAQGKPLRLHVFVDRSIVEVFDDTGLGLTKRVYPTRTDSVGVRVFTLGGDARIRSLDIWEMASIW